MRELDVACHLNVVTSDASPAGVDRVLGPLREAGYTAVVLPPLEPEQVDIPNLAAVFREHDVVPIALADQVPGADVSSPDPHVRQAGADRLHGVLALAAELGGDQLNGVPYAVFGSPELADERAFERSAREVGRLADAAAELGITVTFEVLNRYETGMVNTITAALDYITASGSYALRLHADTFHMAIEETDLLGAIRAAVPKLGYLELGQSARGGLASGAVDIQAVVREALAAGYRGRLGVEAFRRGGLAPDVADVLAIWRDPYADGLDLAREAIRLIAEAPRRSLAR